MKNRTRGIFYSALGILSAFFFVVNCAWAETEEAAEQFVSQPVTITALLGKVEILPETALVWSAAEPGRQLSEGDKIRTGEEAKAVLTLSDGSFIKMKGKSTLEIKTARQKGSSGATEHELDLQVGEIMLELKQLRPGASFKIETPTAIAAVRGTTYYIRTGTKIVDGEEKAFVEIFVDSGVVEYTNIDSGAACLVSGGSGAIVYDDGTIEGPYPVPPAAQDAWRSGYEMKYDDSSGTKKGMRDVEETGGDDSSGDINETTGNQNGSEEGALQERTNEQEIAGLALVRDITDTDGDGTPDYLDDDDDNDNYTDSDENDNATDPLDAASTPPDNDTDFVSDLNDPDDDNDTLSDVTEMDIGTDPFDADTDDDNLSDGDEVAGNTPYRYITDPTSYDTDADGVADGPTSPADRFPLDYFEQKDTDDDTPDYWQLCNLGSQESNLFMPNQLYPGDNEDTFPSDPVIHGDGNVYPDDGFGNPFYGWYLDTNGDGQGDTVVRGYGSRYEMRQATLNNLLEIQNIKQEVKQDINDMLDDMRTREYEAFKTKTFDHQVGKVMTDRWGNRVRVEEYIFKQPTEGGVDTVELLALSLRTAGPNAGISSLDFQVKFDEDISNVNLKSLPWDDYMSNPLAEDFDWKNVRKSVEDDDQLILYKNEQGEYYKPNAEPYNYPVPYEFSLEVKNPYGNSIKATERYTKNVYEGKIEDLGEGQRVWYQYEMQEDNKIYINGESKKYAEERWEEDWGEGWNQANRFTFLDYYKDDSWLMGAFYLIDDSGNLIPLPSEGDERDYLIDVHGIRDCINPDFNLEMVFLSSEFAGTDPNLPWSIEELPDDAYERQIYNTNRTIDVITIPEITEPYRDR